MCLALVSTTFFYEPSCHACLAVWVASPGASAWCGGRQQGYAGDEGGEHEDGHGEEGDHYGALPHSELPPAPPHRRHASALSAALGHQCGEWTTFRGL